MSAFPILQFGTSRFLQAHADLFVSEAMAGDQAIGPIAVVQTTHSGDSGKRLAAFATGRPYPVEIKGLADGAVKSNRIEVRSIGTGVDANRQWREVERLFCAPYHLEHRRPRLRDRSLRPPRRRTAALISRQAGQAPDRPPSRRCRAVDLFALRIDTVQRLCLAYCGARRA
jgi:hypothetical protein